MLLPHLVFLFAPFVYCALASVCLLVICHRLHFCYCCCYGIRAFRWQCPRLVCGVVPEIQTSVSCMQRQCSSNWTTFFSFWCLFCNWLYIICTYSCSVWPGSLTSLIAVAVFQWEQCPVIWAEPITNTVFFQHGKTIEVNIWVQAPIIIGITPDKINNDKQIAKPKFSFWKLRGRTNI